MEKSIPSYYLKWVCEGSKTKKGCVTGIKDDIQSSYQSFWKCDKCEIKICLKCCMKHVLTPAEKEKVKLLKDEEPVEEDKDKVESPGTIEMEDDFENEDKDKDWIEIEGSDGVENDDEDE